MDPFFVAFGLGIIAVSVVLLDLRGSESKERKQNNTEQSEELKAAQATSTASNESFLLNIVDINHQITKIVGLKNHKQNEIDFFCQGKPDLWQSIPHKEDFKEEPNENVQITFHTREESNSDYENGIGELWIQRQEGESLLNFDIEISHNTAWYLSSLKSFDAQFSIADNRIRETDKGEAYKVEYFVIEGLSEKFVPTNHSD